MSVHYVKSVSIGKERYEWLEKHPEIDFSDYVRQALDRIIDEEHDKE